MAIFEICLVYAPFWWYHGVTSETTLPLPLFFSKPAGGGNVIVISIFYRIWVIEPRFFFGVTKWKSSKNLSIPEMTMTA